jgi:uncharacterized protein YukE
MSDNLKGIEDDVQFNWKAADELVAELNSTAAELDKQINERQKSGAKAREQWKGFYGDQFDGRLKICTGDAKRLAEAMRDAAKGLKELIKAAHQEQDRRVKAREWVKEHGHRSLAGQVWHAATDWLLGDDVPPPPPPVDPPKIPIRDTQSTSRGSATPSRA